MLGELIQVKNDEILTTSLVVAEKFNKEHHKVMRAISTLKAQLEGIAKNGDTPHFEQVLESNPQNGQSYCMYYMDRDAFNLLVMGFNNNSPDVLKWKLAFIKAFNEMEERLNSPTLPDNRLEIAKMLSKASRASVEAIKQLYPEYFTPDIENGSFEQYVEENTSYSKWLNDYNVTAEWIGEFPTTDLYNDYMKYCKENRLPGLGKKTFFEVLAWDFHLVKKQCGNGRRYFVSAKA